jgi:hypothetical protein
VHALQRSLDAAKVGVRVDVGDEQDVDVRRTEVLGYVGVVAREHLGHKPAEHNEQDVFVAQLVQQPHKRELGACSCPAGAALIHRRSPGPRHRGAGGR